VAIIPLGYPAQLIDKGKKKRKSIAEVAHLERFGQDFWMTLVLKDPFSPLQD
jgi:hypothetical protein